MTLLSNAVKGSLTATIALGFISLFNAPASAISIALGDGSGFSNVIDFESFSIGSVNGVSSGIATFSSSPNVNSGRIVNADATNVNRLPAVDGNQYLTIGSPIGNPSGAAPGSVTISFSKLLNSFGLLWGTVDSYNSIAFFQGATQVGSFTGTQIANLLPPIPANGTAARFVNFASTGAIDYFDSVRLETTDIAFELDNVSYDVVPTPALLPGLVGMTLAALRKRRQQNGEAGEAES